MVIGVNPGGVTADAQSSEIIEQFVEQAGVTFPVGLDRGTADRATSYGAFLEGNGLSPFPLDVVIDRQGVVRYVSRQYDPEVLLPLVAALAVSTGE